MSGGRRVLTALAVVVSATFVGSVAAGVGAYLPALRVLPVEDSEIYVSPAAWRMPAVPGMHGLRLAMIHDVLLERYATRDAAFDTDRVRWLLARLPATGALDAAQVPQVDSLAVSLVRLGRADQAVAWLRRSAEAQGLRWPPAEGAPGQAGAPDVQTQHVATWSLLGTALIHARLDAALGGDVAARMAVDQGLAALRLAVAGNPAFADGRDRCLITVVEHLLAAARRPALLQRTDAIGAPLAQVGSGESQGQPFNELLWRRLSGRPGHDSGFTDGFHEADADRLVSADDRAVIREQLSRIGAETSWAQSVAATWRDPLEWDRVALGAIGLWRDGAGDGPLAPHLALVLADACERIGQRHLALDAYLLLEGLAERFSSDPATVVWLRAHVAARLAAVAGMIADIDGGNGAVVLATARSRHVTELAWSLEQRRTDHAAQVATRAGATGDPLLVPWSPPHLASAPGAADVAMTRRKGSAPPSDGLALGLLLAGMDAWVCILMLRPRQS